MTVSGIVVSAFALPIVLSRAPGAGPADNTTQTVDNIVSVLVKVVLRSNYYVPKSDNKYCML